MIRVRRCLVVAVLAIGAVGLWVPAAEAGIPTPPARCGGARNGAFNNPTDVVIPTGPATVTSTVEVSGLGPYLFRLGLLGSIAHTRSEDLDITLQSPEGTIVTLTTDNGGINDDVFFGVRFDDSSDPDGAVPYTVNNGLATDHGYADDTNAGGLVPEEAMSAFYSEDPNGTWTLTISDDLAAEGGLLRDWSLDVSTLPAAPTVRTVTRTGAGVAIPTGPAVVTSTIDVAGAHGYLSGMTVTTGLRHTFPSDLDVTLTSPSGTVSTLTTDNGAGADNVFDGTTWSDDADPGGQVPYTENAGLVTDATYTSGVPVASLVPEEAMGAFNGQSANGTWTLTISDDLAGDGGTLDDWSLTLRTLGCHRPDARIRVGRAGALAGNDVYNTTGVGQTRRARVRPGQSVTFQVPVQNDTGITDRLRVKGAAAAPGFRVRYLAPNGRDVTTAVRRGTYRTPVLAPGKIHRLRAVVTVLASAPRGATLTRTLTVRSGTPAVRDTVRYVVTRRN